MSDNRKKYTTIDERAFELGMGKWGWGQQRAGMQVISMYRQVFGRDPEKVKREVRGQEMEVFAYPIEMSDTIDSVLSRLQKEFPESKKKPRPQKVNKFQHRGPRKAYSDRNTGQGGDNRRPYNSDRREGGNDNRRPYNNDRREGGYNSDNRRPYNSDRRESTGGNREGGYNNNRRPYNNDRREGGYNSDNRRPYNNDRRESTGGNREGGYSNNRRPYNNDRREGGYNSDNRRPYNSDRREGGYAPRRNDLPPRQREDIPARKPNPALPARERVDVTKKDENKD